MTEEPYEKRWWALAAICIPLIVVSIDGTILNVALPTISDALKTTSAELIWINSGYIIVFGSTILLMGFLGDKYGRKKLLLLGLVVFGSGSIWAGLSSGAYSLILARGFMGVGGGMIMPAPSALLPISFPTTNGLAPSGSGPGWRGSASPSAPWRVDFS